MGFAAGIAGRAQELFEKCEALMQFIPQYSQELNEKLEIAKNVNTLTTKQATTVFNEEIVSYEEV